MILMLYHKKKYINLQKECSQMKHEFSFKKDRIQDIIYDRIKDSILKTPANSSSSDSEQKYEISDNDENKHG